MSNFEDFKRQYCTEPPTDEQIIRGQQRQIDWLKRNLATLEADKAALQVAVRDLNGMILDNGCECYTGECVCGWPNVLRVRARPAVAEALAKGGR